MIATGTLTNSTQRQFRPLVSTPPSSTPAAAPEPATAPQIPSALLRSAPSLKIAVTSASAAGASIAAPTPWSAREAISCPWLCESPPASDAPPNTSSPIMNMCRRPRRSAIRPPSSSSPPNAKMYAFATQDRLSLAKCRPCWIEGSAMFTTDASRITMNSASASSTSAHHRRGSGGCATAGLAAERCSPVLDVDVITTPSLKDCEYLLSFQ